ncbi:GNAT family N-acetyltransferase [Isoptericola jiangsuensis]|uniref:GNAT family N-acetyltransferase n=1 Tax=Isoptericola jiangsuensis TaxID=548579 RepID=UPI003AAA5EF3
MSTDGSGPVEIDLDAGARGVDEAIVVLHAAFTEYGAHGEPSGAMVETSSSLRAELDAGTRLAVVRIDGTVVAMVKHQGAADGTLSFGRLAILPEVRGRGLASGLVRALRAEARSMGLNGLSCSVRAAEARNIAMYEHLGMTIVGREDRQSLTGAVIPVVVMRDA